MRELITVVLPFGAVVLLIVYLFLLNPDVLTEFGWWLQKFF